MDLKAACDLALANVALRPSDGKTFCNLGARQIAQALGCDEFSAPDLMADAMYDIMASDYSGKWTKANGIQVAQWALAGGLAFAARTSAQLGEAHGHIAAVYPAPTQPSGSLGHDVPMLANIGKIVGVQKSSAVFPVARGEADYYIWAGAA